MTRRIAILSRSSTEHPRGGDVPVGSGFTDASRFQTGNITWTRTITPKLLNELRFATNRSATYDAVPTTTTSPSSLGFLTVNPDDPKGTAPPLMSITGNFSLGPSPQGPTKIHDTTFQYQDTLSWTHGRHDLKFGADLRWVENNFNFDFYNNGSFFFGQGGTYTGNALADFVGGFFDNYYQFSNAVYGIRTHSLYFFGEDAWKATKRLTLNFGVRYEYNSPQKDPHNEIIGWDPGQQSTVFPAGSSELRLSRRSRNAERRAGLSRPQQLRSPLRFRLGHAGQRQAGDARRLRHLL